MSYGFYVYTDRESIATTKVSYPAQNVTYEYDYGTGQHDLGGFTDGDYIQFTAVPANGYKFTQWIYHIGSPTAETQYSTSNPFKYYGSTGNDIYIAAEGVASGSTGKPTVTSVTYHTTKGSLDVTVKIVGTNIRGYTVTLGLSYNDGTSMTIRSKIPITSNSFSTTITAASYDTQTLSVVFDPGGTYAKSYLFSDIVLEQGEDVGDYFEWSNAVAKGLPIKNVSHNEWDNFIDKIKDILTDNGKINHPLTAAKYGYAVGTTYKTMLNDCYLEYDSDFGGYPLYAQQFNVARFIIGSNLPNGGTTGISDKTAGVSKVLASDFITLETCLREWQG